MARGSDAACAAQARTPAGGHAGATNERARGARVANTQREKHTMKVIYFSSAPRKHKSGLVRITIACQWREEQSLSGIGGQNSITGLSEAASAGEDETIC